jgi:hypothetical protein
MTSRYAVVGSALLVGLLLGHPRARADAQQQAPSKPPMSVDGIRDSSETFEGKRVRFTGHVDRVLGPKVLILQDDDAGNKEHLLGVTRLPIGQLLGEGGAKLSKGDRVLVAGLVRSGALSDIARQLGVDLDLDTEKRFRDKPVVVISEIVRTED